jgi:tetratricopeptide (TPR) repeat protein
MKTLMKFFTLLIGMGLCFAGNGEDQQIDRLINDYTFNGQFLKADSLLDDQISRYPDNPKYYALKAPFYFYTRYFNRFVLNGDSLMEKCREYAQSAVDIAERSEMSRTDKFYAGVGYAFLARYAGRGQNRSLWDAYWAARSSKAYLMEVLEEDPEFVDARMNLAVFEYFTATQVTGWFWGTIAWMVGMDGNRDVALQKFQQVAEKGDLFRTEANFVLSVLYRFFENDPAVALQYTNRLLAAYPQNPWLQNQVQELQLFALIDQQGVEILETEFDSLSTKYGINNPGVLNTFGYALNGRGRYEEAIAVLKTNIKLFPQIANGYDSLAEIYLNAGNPEMSAHYSHLCLQKLPADSTINDEFKTRLREINETRLEELGAGNEKMNL